MMFSTLTQLPALPPVTELPELVASPVAQAEKNLPSCRFSPWVRKIPWRRKWQLIPVFLPGESHGQRSLVGYSPWSRRVGHYWSDLACMHGGAHSGLAAQPGRGAEL